MILEFILWDDSREKAKLHCAEVKVTSIQWKITSNKLPATSLKHAQFLLYDLLKKSKKTEARGVHLNLLIF